MDKLQFIMPVRIVEPPERIVTEIYGVEEALTLLQNLTDGLESPIYQRALNSCFAATIEQETAEDARKAFLNYVRVSGILAKDSRISAASAPAASEAARPVLAN